MCLTKLLNLGEFYCPQIDRLLMNGRYTDDNKENNNNDI